MNIDNNETNKTENEDVYDLVVDDVSDATIEIDGNEEQNIENFDENGFVSSVSEVVRILSANSSTESSPHVSIFSSLSSQRDRTVEDKINEANERIKRELFSIYMEEEKLRQQRQKPIMIAVLILLSVQLLFFNILMFVLVVNGAKTIEVEIFRILLDFLKYYIGAVVVELVGLIVAIASNTFSSPLSKNISKIFFEKK